MDHYTEVHYIIFTLPVFSAAMNIRKILTSIFPWSRIRDIRDGRSGGCSEYRPDAYKKRIPLGQNGTILIKYKFKGLNSICLFLMQVWKTEDPCVNFRKRFAHYEIYTWTLCHSYLHEKQTCRIQSLSEKRRESKKLVVMGRWPFYRGDS